MKIDVTTLLVAVFVFAVICGAHCQTIQVQYSSASTIPEATVVANVMKYCKGVEITDNKDNAQYVLTANFNWIWYSTVPNSGASLLLIDSKGKAVYAKEAKQIHAAFKAMCRDYFGRQ